MPYVLAAAPPETDPSDYYKDYGVLDEDTYLLYPGENKPIDIGFSKYAELINPGNGTLGDSLGIRYPISKEPGYIDAFASEKLNPIDWSNGWYMDIHFLDQGVLKNVWAYALYSDLEAAGGDWMQGQAERIANIGLGDTNGGRRTSGYCITDPIKLIYDGPRKSIYLLRTVIYDNDPALGGDALIEYTVQLIFNKVKKYVVEIKDIKRLLSSKWSGDFQVEFSQRGEWDLGTTPFCPAWGEFYNGYDTTYWKHPFYAPWNDTEGTGLSNYPATVDVAQLISTETDVDVVGFWAFWPTLQSKMVEATSLLTPVEVLTSMETVEEEFDDEDLTNDNYTLINKAIEYPRGAGVWSSKPWLFIKDSGLWKTLGGWVWDPDTNTIMFTTHNVDPDDEYLAVYKQWVMGAEANPHPLWPAGMNMTYSITNDEGGAVPYVFGEWDFELTMRDVYKSTHHWRCVSVLGVTDQTGTEFDPDDLANQPAQDLSIYDWISDEVEFQLNETFNPYDLSEASHKSNFRWAQKGEIDSSESLVAHKRQHHNTSGSDNAYCLCDFDGQSPAHMVVVDADWWQYKNSTEARTSERVILYDDSHVLPPILAIRGTHYTIQQSGDPCDATITWVSVPSGYDNYKILYTTIPRFGEWPSGTAYEEWCWATGRWEWIEIGRDSLAADSAGAAMVSAAWQEWKWKEVWLSALDMKDVMNAPGIPYLHEIQNKSLCGSYREDYLEAAYMWNSRLRGRSSYMDDWCSQDWDWTEEIYPYAISSSNIIVVGGPIANLGAEYFNDFTDALVFTEYGNGFYAPGCWGRVSQPSYNRESLGAIIPIETMVDDELWYDSATVDDTVGHAIVSTYLDINGTVGFIVYGYTAEDTYYACYAIRGGLLPWLQLIQEGATTLILEFDYTTFHPVVIHVPEVLGTITECTGFGTNFKIVPKGYSPSWDWEDYVDNVFRRTVEEQATEYGLCYKLVDIEWCASLHPDP
jgi:hypothetical protein